MLFKALALVLIFGCFLSAQAQEVKTYGWEELVVTKFDGSWPSFQVSGFSDGLAIVSVDTDMDIYKNVDSYGCMDMYGNYAIAPGVFSSVSHFSGGLALINNGYTNSYRQPRCYIDKTGKKIIDVRHYLEAEPFSDGLARVKKAANSLGNKFRYGYIDTFGNEVITLTTFGNAYDFSDGLALMGKDTDGDGFWDTHVFIDKSGKEAGINLDAFVAVGDFCDGLARVERKTGYDFLDSNPSIFWGASHYVKESGLVYIDKTGKVVIDLPKGSSYVYNIASNFSDGLALVYKSKDERLGADSAVYIDKTGREVISLGDSTNATDFKDGYATIRNKSGNYFLIRNPFASQSPIGITALPTFSKVYVDGMEKNFDAYMIGQNNYFKLRDIAYILNGTGAQFDVVWDSEKASIKLIDNKSFAAVGGEMAQGDSLVKSAVLNQSPVYLNNKAVSLTAYTINGNNYFKLRDIGRLFDFDVDWNKEKWQIEIESYAHYTED